MCGGNLKQLVRGEYNIPPPHAPIADKEILRQITRGLQYLHEKNICHRDMKPSNIFISRPDATLGPQLKLGNSFGFNRTALKLPLWKLVGMSKCWVAPDIYDANVHTVFTKAMDVFALGLVFAFVLTGGIHAFGTEKEEIVLNIKKKKPMSFTIQQLKDATDGAAAGIYELISSMLSFNPEERPSATGVFNYTFFNLPTFSPRSDGSPPAVPTRRRRHQSSFQTGSTTNSFKRESTDDNENTSPSPQTGAAETVNSLPSLSPIRLPSGEVLLRNEEESSYQQQLPITPHSARPPSPFRDSVSSSATSTLPSSSSSSHLPSEYTSTSQSGNSSGSHQTNSNNSPIASPLRNDNSFPPPLVPIRLPNGESLPKRIRQSEEFEEEENNQGPTTVASNPPNAVDNPDISSASSSSSTTLPLGSPQSHSPFLNLTVDVASADERSWRSSPVPSLSEQPSTSPHLSSNQSAASPHPIVPLSSMTTRKTLLPDPVSGAIASVSSPSGCSLPPPTVSDSPQISSSYSSDRSSKQSTPELRINSDGLPQVRSASHPQPNQKYVTLVCYTNLFNRLETCSVNLF